MEIYTDLKQNTPEWEFKKLGKFSASSCSDLLAGPETASYQNLIKRIAFERHYKSAPETWDGNFWTERGHDLEPKAITEQTFLGIHGDIKQVGLIVRDDWACCSPDLLIGADKLMQIKAPKYTTQIDYILSNKIPSKYAYQMQFELYVSGREQNIFFSYHEILPNVEILLKKDTKTQVRIHTRLEQAKKDVNQLIKKLIEKENK